ncbi:MAG: nucleotidyltransferase domain-containing protein, partial [Mesorhizobium sp.]
MKSRSLLQAAGVFEMIFACRVAGICSDWYVFGSVARGAQLPSDIDILCIVQKPGDVSAVYRASEVHLLRAPIHLRILSVENEASLN